MISFKTRKPNVNSLVFTQRNIFFSRFVLSCELWSVMLQTLSLVPKEKCNYKKKMIFILMVPCYIFMLMLRKLNLKAEIDIDRNEFNQPWNKNFEIPKDAMTSGCLKYYSLKSGNFFKRGRCVLILFYLQSTIL